MVQLTPNRLRRLAPAAAGRIVEGLVEHEDFLSSIGVVDDLRLCHFLAQLAFESAGFRVTTEYASGIAYEGRADLGNIQLGDGPRYRGRGLLQTTGRFNYCAAAPAIRSKVPSLSVPNFEIEPERLSEFPWALLSALVYWDTHKLNRLADNDDIRSITRVVNGGLLGFSDRKIYLERAKRIWLLPLSRPLLRHGDSGAEVIDIQRSLLKIGYRVLVDGVFGDYTQTAICDFQESRQLYMDGIVGPTTWAALTAIV